jgi:hypothetical protein
MLKNGKIEEEYISNQFNYVCFCFRNLEVDLETIWQATNADSMRIREQLHDMRIAS